MSLLGDLLGYDSRGRDLLGENENPDYNCPVCGVDALSHSPEQTAKCMAKCYAPAEKGKP